MFWIWFGNSEDLNIHSYQFRNFMDVAIGTASLVILVIITLYYARETRRLRFAQEEGIRISFHKDHANIMINKLIKPWIQELDKWITNFKEILNKGHIPQEKLYISNSFEIDGNPFLEYFYSHFPKMKKKWEEVKENIRDFNSQSLGLISHVNSDLKTFGIEVVKEWGNEPYTIKESFILSAIYNSVRRKLGNNTIEWVDLTIVKENKHHVLAYAEGKFGKGEKKQLEKCKDLLENNNYFERDPYNRKIGALASKAEDIKQEVEEYKDEMLKIEVYQRFPGECILCSRF